MLSMGCCYAQKRTGSSKHKTHQTTSKKKKAKKPTISAQDGEINGHGYVDLGLPSGTLWATCNIGSTDPKDDGRYFAWGETRSNASGDINDWDIRFFPSNCKASGKDNSWLKSNGYIDNTGYLTPAHDAARANWGSTWRMPTPNEIYELIKYTTPTRFGLKADGGMLYGVLLTSKSNGKSIFFGFWSLYSDYGFEAGEGLDGFYWSSLPERYDNKKASIIFVNQETAKIEIKDSERFKGLLIRPVSDSNRTISQTESMDPTGTINGHDYVDLGLPSGTKWATCNLGASSPEKGGSFFAWGDTSPDGDYSGDIILYELKQEGRIDKKNNLTMASDAAHAIWGATWRIPTATEIKELKKYTTTTWTTYNGKKGCLITSKRNGKSIFIPAAGYKDYDGVNNVGESGTYWGATVDNGPGNKAYDVAFKFFILTDGIDCFFARPTFYMSNIRPVSK